MVLYICSLCNKKFNHKGDYTRHINRKNKCKIIPSNNNNENPNKIYLYNNTVRYHPGTGTH